MRENAFELGARLKAEELAASNLRVGGAIAVGGPGGRDDRCCSSFSPETRSELLSALYQSHYDYRGIESTAEETMDAFCWMVFGCHYAEALRAWDEQLG